MLNQYNVDIYNMVKDNHNCMLDLLSYYFLYDRLWNRYQFHHRNINELI